MFVRKSSQTVLFVAIGTLIAALALTSTVLAATLARGGGAVTAVQTVTANDFVLTTSNSTQTLADMSVNVTVPQGEQALLVVTFSAEMRCRGTSNKSCFIRARIDGQTMSPGEVKFGSVDDSATLYGWEANSMQFVGGPVSAGQHTIDIRWRTEATNTVYFEIIGRTLTVLRSKV